MSRFRPVPKSSSIRRATSTRVDLSAQDSRQHGAGPFAGHRPRRTLTGAIGAICMFALRAIIPLCVALRIHPNTLTLIGVIANVGAAWALGFGRFILSLVIMLVAN